jgi:hypothetical protein
MMRGTGRDDCNIDNINEYHAMRDEALTNVKAPPPVSTTGFRSNILIWLYFTTQ